MKEARYKMLDCVWFHLCQIFRISKSIDTEMRLDAVRAWGKRGNGL